MRWERREEEKERERARHHTTGDFDDAKRSKKRPGAVSFSPACTSESCTERAAMRRSLSVSFLSLSLSLSLSLCLSLSQNLGASETIPCRGTKGPAPWDLLKRANRRISS